MGSSFFSRVWHYIIAPDDIIYSVATVLLYPTLFAEVTALLWVSYQTGSFTLEAVRRHKARKRFDVDASATEIADARRAGDQLGVLSVLARFEYGPVVGPVARQLQDKGMTKLRALKCMGDAERVAMRQLDKTRLFIRIGPILGLMGTLIPISPALVGLAKGDTQTLSANLVVAFSTTVVGLLIGSVSYVISVARERFYAQDMADLEYVLERLGRVQ